MVSIEPSFEGLKLDQIIITEFLGKIVGHPRRITGYGFNPRSIIIPYTIRKQYSASKYSEVGMSLHAFDVTKSERLDCVGSRQALEPTDLQK